MQASVRWRAPQGVLGGLVEAAEARVAALRPRAVEIEGAAAAAPRRASFIAALREGPAVTVIAEIKRRSPSRGAIAESLSAREQAVRFAAGGAAAISVLTEPAQFGGDLSDLDAAQAAVLPLLRKDFIVHPLQLAEAVAHGASAALLIVKALSPERLGELYEAGTRLGLDLLVEVHSDDELALAAERGYGLIGVNNRNLETLEVDAGVTAHLIPLVPPGAVAVYESGVRTRADVERAAALGADAVLIGTSLSASADATASVRALSGVARQGRRAS